MGFLSSPQQFCFTTLHSISKQTGIAYIELSQSHKGEKNVQFLKWNYFVADLSSFQISTKQS